jgi:hypothetical protein
MNTRNSEYPIISSKQLSVEQQEVQRKAKLVSSSRAKLMLISLQLLQSDAPADEEGIPAVEEVATISQQMLDLMKSVNHSGEHEHES